MRKRYNQISIASKDLAEEAFKAYAGKKDYKRAIEIYGILATYQCIPSDISSFSKKMLSRLSKKIEENT
ncbi:MAG: hypothetical protein ACRDA3_02445 [Peptostreptococcaceae bacterium]